MSKRYNLPEEPCMQPQDELDSAYLNADDTAAKLNLGELFSHEFSNIMPLYSSSNGPIEIHTATRYGKRFILKGLKEQYRDDPVYAMSLVKEFEIGIQLDHPNIRRTVGLENVPGCGKAIVLEYVDGCTLDTMLSRGKIAVSTARSIARQVGGALGYLHRKQVYHRDLKPSNILISHDGNVVKIIDFNLSDSGDFIILKNPAGSRRYMAPEQFEAGARPSAVADIYSFGVVAGDLASASGDEKLAQIAVKCSNPDSWKRPQSISSIRMPSPDTTAFDRLSEFLSSKALTWIMLCICLALATEIAFTLITPA